MVRSEPGDFLLGRFFLYTFFNSIVLFRWSISPSVKFGSLCHSRNHWISLLLPNWWDFPGDANGKESAYQHRRHKKSGFDTWVRKIPWRRAWQSTPVLLPGESNGQRSQIGGHGVFHKGTGSDHSLEWESDSVIWGRMLCFAFFVSLTHKLILMDF